MPKLEIPIFSSTFPSSPLPHRLELNAPGSYPAGGLTPSLSTLTSLTSHLDSISSSCIPLRVMIRPRGSPASVTDFIYTPEEIEEMRRSIRAFKAAVTQNQHRTLSAISKVQDPKNGTYMSSDNSNAHSLEYSGSSIQSKDHSTTPPINRDDSPSTHPPRRTDFGFVFGVLTQDPSTGKIQIDKEANKALVDEAGEFSCTFHRAVDSLLLLDGGAEIVAETLVRLGFDAVLTSGGQGRAVDHLDSLKRFVEAVHGRMDVIVGGGVRAGNAEEIARRLGRWENVWIHSSCITKDGERVDEEEVSRLLKYAE